MKQNTLILLSILLLGCGNNHNTKQNNKEQLSNTKTYDEGVVINGIKWATRNVDAPGTFTDKPENFGMFYQFGRKIGWSTFEPMVNSNGGTIQDGILTITSWEKNEPCPQGWRVPTIDEIKSLENTHSRWTTTPANGRIYYGTGNNTIFLPAAGCCLNNGTLSFVGGTGVYWSKTQKEDLNTGYFYFNSEDAFTMDYCMSSNYCSVRCVTDTTMQKQTTDKGVIINGVKWATRNVNTPGTFADNPESAGKFYKWNSKTAWNTTDEVVTYRDSIPYGTFWEKANDPCPQGWRIPTMDDIMKLYGDSWTTTPVNGCIFGSGDNIIFLPAAGCIQNRVVDINYNDGYYWSSDIGGAYLHLNSYTKDAHIGRWRFDDGRFSVRCVAE